MAVTTAFRHAHMVHHEQVYVQLISASSTDVLCPCDTSHLQRREYSQRLFTFPSVSYEFDAASVAADERWHVPLLCSEVEGIMTPWIGPTVAFETVNFFAG